MQRSGVLTADDVRWLMAEAQRLIDDFEPRNIANLRDRAIIGIMGYAQASADAVIAMQVRDYYALGDRRWVRLWEDGIERHEIVDRRLEPHIDAYLAAAAIADEPRSPLFRSTLRGTQRLSMRRITRRHVLSVIKDITERPVTLRRHEVVESKPKKIDRRSEIIKNKLSADLLEERFCELIESITTNSVIGIRDRAIIGLMLYASLSPEFISEMLVSHYKIRKDQSLIQLDDEHASIAASPALATLMREYLGAARLRRKGRVPLFSIDRNRPMTVADIQKMIRQRLRRARLHASAKSSG